MIYNGIKSAYSPECFRIKNVVKIGYGNMWKYVAFE